VTLRYLLDTDTCIHAIKQRSDRLRRRFNERADALAISSITLAELRFGAEKSARAAENHLVVESFAARLDILPFGDRAAAHYGAIRAELERAGKIIGPYDMLIAAHARSEGLTLVSGNRREFDRVPGLRVENWI